MNTCTQRILFTLGALIIYRLGTYIPVPGINPTVLNEIVNQTSGGVLGMFNMFSGGALGRMTIFALTIIPYISASIIMQLMSSLSPQIAQLKKEGETGRQIINQYTRYLTPIQYSTLLNSAKGELTGVGLELLSKENGDVQVSINE